MKNKTDIAKGVCICVAICTIGIAAYLGYIRKLNDYATNSAYISLAETAVQQKFNLNQELAPGISTLKDTAEYLVYSPDAPDQKQKSLEMLTDKTHFEALSYYDSNGRRSISAGPPIETSIPKSISTGVITDDVYYEMNSESPNFFLMLITVRDANGQYLGTLAGAHKIGYLQEVLLPFFNRNGITYIVNKNGELVTSSRNSVGDQNHQNYSNLWEQIDSAVYEGYDTAEQMKYKVAHDGTGNMIYLLNGEKRYAHYEPAGISDWYVFTVVGDEAVAHHRDLVLQNAFILTMIMIGTFFTLVIYILHQQLKHNNALKRSAYYDELCDCPNLVKFKQSAQQFIDQHRDEKLVMIKLDIDRFKLVNQMMGTETGDVILKNLSAALMENTENDECRFARAHDDEFYALQRYREQPDLTRMRHSFYEGFLRRMGKDFLYHIQFVSGVYYMSLENCTSATDAIEKANIAHQKAKATGLEMCVYDRTFIKDALRQKYIEEQMESALLNREFQVYFQPQCNPHTNAIIGAEALVRWFNGENEIIYPDEFIPLFEENNFIIRLDMYMFENVCRITKEWLQSGFYVPTVSVNFARNHLANIDFVRELCDIADRYGVPHQLLEIELTERVIAQGEEFSLRILEDLHENGFSLAMDDFGTGYSSLSLLKNTQIDVIKIDKSFFDKAEDQPRTKAVLSNVLRLAKDLHAYTIAEGVETEHTANLLRDLGCDAIQGYYYGRPVNSAKFTKILSERLEQGSVSSARSGEDVPDAGDS